MTAGKGKVGGARGRAFVRRETLLRGVVAYYEASRAHVVVALQTLHGMNEQLSATGRFIKLTL